LPFAIYTKGSKTLTPSSSQQTNLTNFLILFFIPHLVPR
jgi:hypothetical protein